MNDAHLDAELLVNVLGQVLRTIDGAMLTTGTAEAEHQRSEAALDVTTHMSIGQLIDGVEEGQDLAVVLKEADDGFVESRQLLIRLVTARVVGRTTVKDVAATIARLVLRNALAERETEDADDEWSLSVVLRESGGTVLRMGLIGVIVGNLITVGTRGRRFYLLELGQKGESTQHIHQMGIGEQLGVHRQQLSKVSDGRRYRLDKVLLAFEIAAETVGTENLQDAE